MESLDEKSGLSVCEPVVVYHEPIKGEVHKYRIVAKSNEHIYICSPSGDVELKLSNKVYPDGSYYLEGVGSFYPETEEWKIKYQNSLYLRVCQGQVAVYFVNAMKRGKVNTRALVVDDNGACYSTFVPTYPPPRLGEKYMKLRMDLTVVSLAPVKDLYDKVVEARILDPSL